MNNTPATSERCDMHPCAVCDSRALKRELAEARETIADLEVRHGATMLHSQTIVDDANELRKQRDRLAEALREADELLASAENTLHGDGSDDVTVVRMVIEKALAAVKGNEPSPSLAQLNKPMPTPTDCRKCGLPYYGAAGMLCRDCKSEAKRPSDAPTGSAFWVLFEHMSKEHGLTLLESELSDICHAVDRMRAKWKADEAKRRCRTCWGSGQVEIQSGPHYRTCDACGGSGQNANSQP